MTDTPTTSPTTRARYEAATAGIEAWAILSGTELVGRIVIRRRSTSSGHTVRCFLHILGHPMVDGEASGGGYGMASAALADAIDKLPEVAPPDVVCQFDEVLRALDSCHVDNALASLGNWYAVRAIA